MRFASPWFLLLLVTLPPLIWWQLRPRARATVRFSSLGGVRRVAARGRQRLRHLPLGLRVLALALLVVALARPQQGQEQQTYVSEGVAMMMVLDRSSSMGAEMSFAGQRLDRLETAKHVFRSFVLGDGDELSGRPSDLIGLVTFAGWAETVCPLTLTHDALLQFVRQTKLVSERSEDGTAIGDAVALAAARLKTAEEELARQASAAGTPQTYEITSKIIVLLTDGNNNRGDRSPMDAAELAAKWGIKVYTIGIGGDPMTATDTVFGRFLLGGGSGIDERPLRLLAERTGGVFRLATDAESLAQIYAEIDQLEKSEIVTHSFIEWKEQFAPFALAGLLLMLLAFALEQTLLRRLP